eukprot:GHUV01021138.1.p1 GENE.GHUV01021138.1~~GHUV01021138.1.p1  ORF type:complete len:881 (+),score=267.61 GHUV01021138.1:104-2644(+)
MQPSRGLKLQSKLQVSSVCKGGAKQVNYLWTCASADGSTCTLPDAAANQQLLLGASDLAAASFKLETDYTFTLTAGFTGSAVTSTASTVVRFARSPLRAALAGPSGDVPATKNFTFDASKSSDPDNPTTSLKYDFSCSPQPCFSDVTYTGVRPKQSSWMVDASQLSAINQPYTFTVTVSGTAAGDTRQATASLTITPRPGNPPTGTITRFCGYDATGNLAACLAKHNPTQDLLAILRLDPDFRSASVQWVNAGGQQLQEGVNAQGTPSTTLTVHPTAFPTAGAVILQAVMRMPGVNGTASINVPLNNPPNCPQAPCFFTDINSTVFPAYTFVGAASGWSDADGDVLTYEFGQMSNGDYRALQPAGPSTTYTFRGFEPGSYQLYACAIDTSGARTCATAPIQVQQPAAVTPADKAALVESSVTKIDVEQLASTGDVSAVTDAMQEIASLAAFSTSPGLAAKQNALLTTLTTVMNPNDPGAMATSLNAADRVSDAGTAALTPEAGAALLNVTDAFVTSNADAAGVTDNQVNTATKVLVKGLDAAYSSPTNTGSQGRRRALLATSTASISAYNSLTSTLSGLMSLMAAGTPTGGSKTLGTSDVCMSVARESPLDGSLDSRQLIVDCSGGSSTAAAAGHRRRRSLLLDAPGATSVTMPDGFSAACATDPVCNQTDTTTVSQSYVSDPGTILGNVTNWPHASLVPGAQSGTQLTPISGVLTFSIGAKTTGPICSTANCTATLTIPVAGYNPDLSTTCLRLDPDPTASLAASSVGVAVVPSSITGTVISSVNCTSSQLGQVVAVQYTPAPGQGPATSPSPSPAASPQEAYAGVDDSPLNASDVGQPIAFSFK